MGYLGILPEKVYLCGVFNSLGDQVDQWVQDLLVVQWGPEKNMTR